MIVRVLIVLVSMTMYAVEQDPDVQLKPSLLVHRYSSEPARETVLHTVGRAIARLFGKMANWLSPRLQYEDSVGYTSVNMSQYPNKRSIESDASSYVIYEYKESKHPQSGFSLLSVMERSTIADECDNL